MFKKNLKTLIFNELQTTSKFSNIRLIFITKHNMSQKFAITCVFKTVKKALQRFK